MAKKNGTNIGKQSHIGKLSRGHLYGEFHKGKDGFSSGGTGHVLSNPMEHQKFQSLSEHASPGDHYEEGPCDMSQESEY